MIDVVIFGQNPFPSQEARLSDITLLPVYHCLVNREILNCPLIPEIKNYIIHDKNRNTENISSTMSNHLDKWQLYTVGNIGIKYLGYTLT